MHKMRPVTRTNKNAFFKQLFHVRTVYNRIKCEAELIFLISCPAFRGGSQAQKMGIIPTTFHETLKNSLISGSVRGDPVRFINNNQLCLFNSFIQNLTRASASRQQHVIIKKRFFSVIQIQFANSMFTGQRSFQLLQKHQPMT